MANSPSPWSVKGVDPEAREAAKIAARKAGMTVGAWLSQMIRQAAAEQLRGGGQPRQDQGRAPQSGFQNAPPPDGRYGPGYEQVYGAPPQYAPPPQQPPPPGSSPPPAPTMQAVFESIQRLSSRIEQSERRTAETIAPIAEKVSELSKRIETAKTSDGTSTAPVERAMQKIADRLEKIEEGRSANRAPGAMASNQDNARKGLFGLFRRD